MLTFILRRLMQAVITVWVVVTLVFGLIHITGNPVSVLAPPQMNQQDRARLEHNLGLDKPLYVQYGKFLEGIVHGNLGVSYYSDVPALPLVVSRLPVTVKLVALAIGIAVFAGVPLGITSAIYADTILDSMSRFVSVLGSSIPTFFLGILLIFGFSVEIGLLPSSGVGSFEHYILPACTLAFFRIALFTRMIRTSLIESLGEDYVRTARAKGASELRVVGKHALRTALIPFITVFGLQFGQLLAGAVITETIFALPGMNRLALQALYRLDFPVILSYVLIVAAMFSAINFLVDVTYGVIDPRVRHGH
ncbi:MAG TPA: ABC transporter permease [Gammaproteobacteria bacterium]|nr:ABC transporter permease [Gammaproteobacteria bacterium]